MKTQLLNIKAALLYLLYFQITEASESDEQEDDINKIADQLFDMDYPAPGDVIFDNDGIPQIQWPDNFNCQEFYDLIDYNIYYFKVE